MAGGVDADGGDVAVAVAAQGDDAVAGADFKPGAGDDAAFRDEEGGGHGVVEGEGGGGGKGGGVVSGVDLDFTAEQCAEAAEVGYVAGPQHAVFREVGDDAGGRGGAGLRGGTGLRRGAQDAARLRGGAAGAAAFHADGVAGAAAGIGVFLAAGFEGYGFEAVVADDFVVVGVGHRDVLVGEIEVVRARLHHGVGGFAPRRMTAAGAGGGFRVGQVDDLLAIQRGRAPVFDVVGEAQFGRHGDGVAFGVDVRGDAEGLIHVVGFAVGGRILISVVAAGSKNLPRLDGCALLCREGHGGGCIPLLVVRGGGGDILNGSGVRTGVQVGGGDIRVRDGTGGGVVVCIGHMFFVIAVLFVRMRVCAAMRVVLRAGAGCLCAGWRGWRGAGLA